MAYRGRGRGRGRGGFGSCGRGIPEPFILFPEDVVLPDISDVKEETALVVANKKLQIYWKSSPYYLKKPTKKCGENDIKLYSKLKKEYLSAELSEECGENDIKLYSKLKKEYFPADLFEGKKKVDSSESKGFSSQNNDQLKFDDFIYREQKYEEIRFSISLTKCKPRACFLNGSRK